MKQWLNSSLTSEEIYDRYGHGLSEEKIMSLYKYEAGELSKEKYSVKEYMITYDPLTAYALHMPFDRSTQLSYGEKYIERRELLCSENQDLRC